ncbi:MULTISPECIES: chorismate mutase [Candidatus Neomicrothrix]|uniref:chorismate mutase n=1 Tax=Candidatus Neomicrothrix parvicella RN1 TaxID=1229780 RepID=R4YZ73_9ACTN|nr:MULTISPECIES: chorismate mutase [Microthrix]CCM63710.1 Chorismate mutase [Candidatus Microthrix parvicella RN1]
MTEPPSEPRATQPAPVMRGLRGATTFDVDERDHVCERTVELLHAMVDRNGLEHNDLVSVLFTATDDLHSVFPALGARKAGFGDIPLICARELDIHGATPQCIRILLHVNTSTPRNGLHHVYLHGAMALRDDLPS